MSTDGHNATTDPRLAALRSVLDGDLRSLAAVSDHAAIAETAASAGPLLVSAEAVARVLEAYAAGHADALAVRRWAVFVRQGFLPETRLPVLPVDLRWEVEFEDAMAEATMRREKLGDAIDGELRPGETDRLITWLRPPEPGDSALRTRHLVDHLVGEVDELMGAGRVGLYEFVDELRDEPGLTESDRRRIASAALERVLHDPTVRLVRLVWGDPDYRVAVPSDTVPADADWSTPTEAPYLAVEPI